MIYQLLFIAALLTGIVVCGLAVYTVRHRPVKPFARNLLLMLVAFEIFLAVFHILAARNTFPTYWNWFFDLQYERNLGAMFSSVQLMLVAAVALINALLTPGLKIWQRLYWLLLTATFIFLSFDEFYAIHETWGGRVPTSAWELPYAISGGVLFLISAAAYWFGFRRDWRVFLFMLGGIIILAMGAVAIEKFVKEGFVEADASLRWLFLFEELFEMIGATLILTGLLSYASEHIVRWPSGTRVIALVGAAWAVWLMFALFVLDILEARYLANPVQVDYDDGLLSLVGYEVTPAVAKPGDEVALTLYWRANRPLSTDYSVSIHVLEHPDIDSVAQADDLHVGAIPSTAWFPGIVSSRTLYIRLPRNLPTPASYWLTLRVWSGPWPQDRPWSDTIGLPITHSENRQLLGEDSVILARIPALPTDAPTSPTNPGYQFTADGFALEQITLPDSTVETHQLKTEFSWATNTVPSRDLTQFFHLIAKDGGAVFAFDQQPFAGRFPTSDWPAKVRFVDSWTLQLPDEMPAGRYDVYTGLYALDTMERAPVIDASGTPVQNNAILLGSIDYAPNAELEAALAADIPGVCYALSDTNSINGSEADTLVMMNTETGEAVEIDQTGTIKVEGVAFSEDFSVLYAVDERAEIGQFGLIDAQTGQLTLVGSGLATAERPARSPAFYDSVLKDIDSLALDPQTGILWGILQDEENLLFQIDPETGEFIPDAFAPGYDYLKINLSDGYVNVKDLAIDPDDGTFYLTLGSDAFDSYLASIDFDTVDLDAGTVDASLLTAFTFEGQPIRDIEALSMTRGGTLFAISSNNSNTPENYDRLWRVNPTTGEAAPVGSFTQYVDFVDYEAVACVDGAP